MNESDPIAGDNDEREEIADGQLASIVTELLSLLPADVVADLRERRIKLGEEGLAEGMMDHISRHPALVADIEIARRLRKVQKALRAIARHRDPSAVVSNTVRQESARVGRNDTCPCGSGKKYKLCCLRKKK